MKNALWLCIRRRLPGLALYALAAGLFLLMGYLTGAPLEGMLYAAVLCLCIYALYSALSIRREYQRHRVLEGLCRQPLLDGDELPAARSPAEEDYRALALLNAQAWHKAQDDMDAMRRERDEYAALWAHQIKVPISAQKLLLAEPKPDASALSAELFKIEQYVEMTLGYERLNGPGDWVLRRCEIGPIMLRCARRFGPLFIQKKLRLDYQPTSLIALTDDKWLAFVLEQLLSNAIKYTRKGVVTLRADEEAQTLMVEDTGIGIAPEDLPRIFDQGYTGLNGRRDKHATGLGLYLCRRALDRLGHTITVESQVGRGTRMTVHLARETIDFSA